MTKTSVRKQEQHGKKKTPEYRAWAHMKERCHNTKDAAYRYYGGRGIGVCQEWKESFMAFYNDMGERPSPTHSLDRINNDKGYDKENCKWSTREEQSQNRRGRSDNKTGIKGVTIFKPTGKYKATIAWGGKQKHLGYHGTLEEAVQARQEAEIQYYQQVKVN